MLKKRETGVLAGGRKNLKKGAVSVVVRVAIARAVVVATAEPGLDAREEMRLPVRFGDKGPGALSLGAPTAALQSAPKQQVEDTGGDIDGLDVVGADRREIDTGMVSRPKSERPVICLQNGTAAVVVADRKDAPFTAVIAGAHLMSQGAVEDGCIYLVPAIHLEDAARGTSRHEGNVRTGVVDRVEASIEAAGDVSETKIADQTLGDAIALYGSKRFVLGRDLGSIEELAAAEQDGLFPWAFLKLEPAVCLFGKYRRGVCFARIGVITSAKTKLALRAGCNCVVREAQQDGGREFNFPIELVLALGEPEPENDSEKAYWLLAFP